MFYKSEMEKYNIGWVYVTHEVECDVEEMKKSLKEWLCRDTCCEGDEIWFKMEPPIVSICCRNVQSASKILDLAKICGLKNCGIRSISRVDGTVMLTLVDTHHIESLVAVGKIQVVSDAYLNLLAVKAKEKLVLSRERFDRFCQQFQLKLQ
eukprot:TRINITY_DN5694_c0_g1_i2.p1 TRINITY_DN5694_c0_g1~~TRINITY_DN5694_c0_g1_i2.p1  ORF type:complete len:151 (-),score=30.46 TRINITY_DN5694_c0_g1_i2:63-515(-)